MDTTAFINFFEGLTLCHGVPLSQALIATQVSLKLVHVSIEYIMQVGKSKALIIVEMGHKRLQSRQNNE